MRLRDPHPGRVITVGSTGNHYRSFEDGLVFRHDDTYEGGLTYDILNEDLGTLRSLGLQDIPEEDEEMPASANGLDHEAAAETEQDAQGEVVEEPQTPFDPLPAGDGAGEQTERDEEHAP